MMNAREKIEKVRNLLRDKGLDGVLLRKRRSFSWLTNGRANYIFTTSELGVADLLIFEDKVYCVTTKMEFARIQEEELSDLEIVWITPEWYEGHQAVIDNLCLGKKMGTDVCPETIPLRAGIDLSKELAELTYVLSLEEIERYRWLSQNVARALELTCRQIEPGMTEFEIQALLTTKVVSLGIQPQVLLVATDRRIYKFRHPIPTEKKLENYAMLVLCGEKGGLVANATRFVHFGPISQELQQNKRKLLEIDLAFNLATRPGVPIKDVFRQGIEVYRKMGYEEDWRSLHQGGPTGYASREFLANFDCEGVVQNHQAFAWNPSLKGIKSEDTILVTENGPEFLTHTGEWEYMKIEKDGKIHLRPDILIR
ncbi:M24 family metallopeptidase [Desulfosporosinus acidiphilus]|nr:M24 family metallopeptidase [Desulfosporosinus acidiphilus]